MMKRLPLLLAVALGASVLAQTQNEPDAPPEGRTMRPAQLDLRLTADTDILLVYLDLGVGGDFGLVPLGPGTLSVGGELDFGFCGSLCLGLSALTGLNWSIRNYTPFVRVAYHYPLKVSVQNDKVDVYGLAMAGPVFATIAVEAPDRSIRVTGSDVSFGVGFGAGANYFFSERLFVGLEGRLRYARGRYETTVEIGQYTFSEAEQTWDLSGVNILVFLGVRI